IAPERRSLLNLFMWVHDQYASTLGAARWFCKDKNLIDHALRLAPLRRDIRFVFMYRDPRDVFASYKAAPGGFKHAYRFTDQWATMQAQCLDFAEAEADMTFRVAYESLLANSQKTVRELCEFLGVAFEPVMLESGGTASTVASNNSYWRNMNREILRDNFAKYRKNLSRSEIRVVEGRAWAEMQRLGYEPDIAS